MASDIDTLVDMGFSRAKVQKAWRATNGAGLQPAMDWLLAHPEITDEPEDETTHSLSGPTNDDDDSSKDKEEGEIKEGEQTAQSLKCNDCGKLFRNAASAEHHAIKTTHQNFSESTEAIAPLTEEEKRQKLADLKAKLAAKRANKAFEEAEERKQAERIRRKAGQDISAAREKLEEQQLKKAFEAKKREKEADKLAKAKIKAQIEADKRERAAKREAAKKAITEQSAQQASASASLPTAAPGAKKEYTEARLQFRIPGMAPITHTFPADAPFEDVNSFLLSQGCDRPFTVSMTFPRKTFGAEETGKTLRELNLVPSTALVVTFV
ncbi:ubiquitin-related domain-containing protein [Dichotomocladium elegans]|nr:ubiquitin-related domain-containing protein [Dichotomocladium elegans]